MQITSLSREEFLDLFFNKPEEFMERVDNYEAFVVRQMYPGDEIKVLRDKIFEGGLQEEPSWHPLFDGCPDYHRLHDDYPKAHVKAKMHAFYHHGYYDKNNDLFHYFSDIFHMKNTLAGYDKNKFIVNIPSSGIVSRVNCQNYSKGGGYIAEHTDPVSEFAKIQTLIQASKFGEDFKSGGLYAREKEGAEKIYLDPHTEIGDLILLSPGIIHGVEEVDPGEEYNWTRNNGKWTIFPIIIHSDYDTENKPKQTY